MKEKKGGKDGGMGERKERWMEGRKGWGKKGRTETKRERAERKKGSGKNRLREMGKGVIALLRKKNIEKTKIGEEEKREWK